MVDWKPYLESICEKYAQWWDTYTLTNVVGNKYDKKVRKCLLLDLQAIALKPETVKPEREEFLEAREEREVFNVLEGLRKYALEHVLLTGRPGSGKSTALVRLLLEEAEKTSPQTPLRSGEGLNIAPPSLVGKGVGGLGQIPVLVELRYYETSILDLITAFLHRHDPSLTIDSETIKTLLRQGQFLLLIDGVNELPSLEAQRNLQKFRQDYQQSTPMVFTTRDLGVGGDLGINKRLEMQPLTETQMGEFVRGYLPETGEQMLQQLGGRLREFGETPLLLMMLCSVFASNENQIPPNLGSVFRRFTEIYDGQLKQDIPVTDESRRWWKRLLQHLAWVMMGGCRDAIYGVSTPTEFMVAIPRQQAEEIFTEYLEGKVNCAADCAISWLNDLLKHHLIQIGTENKIEFRHQLIQEYYAAERFLREVGKLSNDELQWNYLNYLKWTEPAALMLGLLDDKGLALRVVRLALQIDWQLGARLAGEVKLEWQEKTVGLVESLNIPLMLKIRLLDKTKSSAAIPSLIKLLEDEDSDVRNSAVYALAKIKSSAAIPSLIQLIKDEDSDVRNSAVYALAKIKSSAAIPSLIQLIKDEDSDVRNSAAYALGEIKSSAAIPGLIQLLEDKNLSVRVNATEALGKIKSEAAIYKLITFLEDKDVSIRDSATSALILIKSEVVVFELIKLIEHKHFLVRSRSAYVLGEIKSEAAIDGLIKLLEDENSSVRSRSAYALGEIKSEAAIDRLIKLLEDEDILVCYRACDALGKLQSNKAIPGLIKLLKHKSLSVRFQAATAITKIRPYVYISELNKILKNSFFLGYSAIILNTTIPDLIKLLEDEDLDVRSNAAFTLGKIKSSAAIHGLIKLLEDEYPFVRYCAASALGEIKSEAAISGLIKLLKHQNSNVRYSAASALGKIKSSAAISSLTKLLKHQNSNVRKSAVYALGEIKSSAAIPNLIQVLEDEDSNVRNRAVYALGEIKSEATIISLIKILNNHKFLHANNGEYTLNALNALEKIQEHLKYYKPAPIRTMSNILSHNYALLIGVGECEEPKLSLPVTVKDIQAIKTLLTDQNLCGYIDSDRHLRLLYNKTATSENILDGLNWLKQQAENDPEATIFIYYSGHGCLDESGDYYLIPHESDRVDIPNTALPATKFNTALQQIPAQRLLVIIDSCHAQGMASSKEGANNRPPLPKGFTQTALPKNIIDELKQGTGRVVFTSSTGNQLSWIRPDGKMSVYTYHLLEALQGAANQAGDKVVRVSHLMNYLGKSIPQSAQDLCKAEQTPFFDFATEDFPVALLHGGKGLATEGWDKQQADEKIREIYNNLAVNNSDVGNIVNVIGGNNNFGDISSSKGK